MIFLCGRYIGIFTSFFYIFQKVLRIIDLSFFSFSCIIVGVLKGVSRLAPLSDGIKNAVNRFFSTPYYILAVAAVSLAAHLLSAELAAYTLFTLVAVYVGICGSDLLPLTPLFLFCYLIPSAANNPGRNEASVFSGSRGLWILGLGILITISLVLFIVRNRKTFFAASCRQLPGMLVLCAAYLLSGIGSAAYPAYLKQNLLYSFLQCACLLIPYWLFCGGIRWDSVRKEYLCWLGLCAGLFVLAQVLNCYATQEVLVNGAIVRTRIFTGWGMYNNIGAVLAMMIPFAFSLGLYYKNDLLGLLFGTLFLGGVLLTCSRGSILTGGLIFCVCLLLLVRYSKKRLQSLLILLLFVGAALTVCIMMRQTLLQWFADLIHRGLDPHTRDEIYVEGIALFKQAPVFGNSFFSPGFVPWDFSTVDALSAVIPPRWHNTIIQLLVSTGVVGLIAYLLHRASTLVLFIKRRSRENSFILCSIAVLLIASLLDCHFFNLGPVLFYSTMLAFAEHQNCHSKKP